MEEGDSPHNTVSAPKPILSAGSVRIPQALGSELRADLCEPRNVAKRRDLSRHPETQLGNHAASSMVVRDGGSVDLRFSDRRFQSPDLGRCVAESAESPSR